MFKLMGILVLCAGMLLGQDFSAIDYYVKKSISEKVTPGATVIVGKPGEVLYEKAFGNYTYEKDSPEVKMNTIYDMASVTKVAATTMCVMKLYDEGKIKITDKVADYLPEFAGNEKGDVTIENLLLHNSGLPSYMPPGEDDVEAKFKRLFGIAKAYPTCEGTTYSCLNFITLMKVVESVVDMPMYKFYKENFTEPMGMTDSYFAPPASIKDRIAPASPDIQGVVHDPLARSLKGYSGNAGLFSTIEDMSKICQMLLNKGEFNGKRYFKESTVEKFTKTKDADFSTRGLGFDTNSNLARSCGELFSKESYGHTGFTGTSMWCDPERNLYVVILTNRVYPDEKASVSSLRHEVHGAVIKALDHIPPQPLLKSLNYEDGKAVINWEDCSYLGAVDSTVVEVKADDKVITKKLFQKCGDDEIEVEYNKTLSVGLYNYTSGNKSISSDIYVLGGKDPEILIVDGCDSPANEKKKYFMAFTQIADGLKGHSFVTVNNDDLVDGLCKLEDYKAVIWIIGEDNNADDMFNADEQSMIKDYVTNGGNIILSGTEIGWVFGRKYATPENYRFFKFTLNAKMEGDASKDYTVKGVEGSLYDGFKANYGNGDVTFHPGYPDFVSARLEGKLVMKYGNDKGAAILSEIGKGKLIYCAFPVETLENMDQFFDLTIRFFGI